MRMRELVHGGETKGISPSWGKTGPGGEPSRELTKAVNSLKKEALLCLSEIQRKGTHREGGGVFAALLGKGCHAHPPLAGPRGWPSLAGCQGLQRLDPASLGCPLVSGATATGGTTDRRPLSSGCPDPLLGLCPPSWCHIRQASDPGPQRSLGNSGCLCPHRPGLFAGPAAGWPALPLGPLGFTPDKGGSGPVPAPGRVWEPHPVRAPMCPCGRGDWLTGEHVIQDRPIRAGGLCQTGGLESLSLGCLGHLPPPWRGLA